MTDGTGEIFGGILILLVMALVIGVIVWLILFFIEKIKNKKQKGKL